MTDEECEIEYLDEDEELVQQCVQVVQSTQAVSDVFTLNTAEDLEDKIVPLLIERKPTEPKRKIKVEEEDSDYDPSEDLELLKNKKKKTPAKKPPKPITQTVQGKYAKTYSKSKKITQTPIQELPKDPIQINLIKKVENEEENIEERRKLNIQIPDYEDPLCLPVRALKNNERELRNLRQWNNTCLNAFKKADTVLKADSGMTRASTRTVVLRNAKNKVTGKIETTVWGKIQVESENKIRKAEAYQCVLPRYREKKLLKSFNLTAPKVKSSVRHKYEVLLTREEQKDGEVLVAYKPNEGVSAVYRSIEQDNTDSSEDTISKMSLKEVTCCKLCAPCYQTSWRGVRRSDKKDNIPCKICSHTYVSVYNLLSHLKTHHTNSQVNKHKNYISKSLASVVDYHYKCRICQQQFLSIKLLRSHVNKHKSTRAFRCEVGNHMTS